MRSSGRRDEQVGESTPWLPTGLPHRSGKLAVLAGNRIVNR